MFRSVLAFVAALTVTIPAVAQDENGIFRVRGGISLNDFNTVWSGGELEANYLALNLGVTYITPSQWYADLGYKTETSADWNTSDLLPGTADEDFARRDITLTIGKVLQNGIQLFVGYQDSESTMDLPLVAQQALGWVAEEKFEIDGYFVGIGRSFSIGGGALNLNGSIGKMDGDLYDANGIRNAGSGGGGYSLGAGYTYYFGTSTSVNVEVKHQSYSYDFNNDDIIITAGDDEMTMFGLNINRQF
jgi:hypothetical protein